MRPPLKTVLFRASAGLVLSFVGLSVSLGFLWYIDSSTNDLNTKTLDDVSKLFRSSFYSTYEENLSKSGLDRANGPTLGSKAWEIEQELKNLSTERELVLLSKEATFEDGKKQRDWLCRCGLRLKDILRNNSLSKNVHVTFSRTE